MSRVKRQHFVPQFYLRNFAANEAEQIHVFDKPSRRGFPSSVRRIASRRAYYDLAELDEAAGVDQALEKHLGHYEGVAAAAVQIVLDDLQAGRPRMNRDARIDLALYLPLQLLRTEEAREDAVQLSLALRKELFIEHLERKHPDLAPHAREGFHLSMTKEARTAVHAQLILDKELRNSIAESLITRYWVIIENTTPVPFYTSDHPVVHKGHIKHPWRSMQGLCSPGVEIAFPLSSRYLLTILDPGYFPHAKLIHRRTVPARPENVEYYNSLQVIFAHQQLYASAPAFDLVSEMIEEDAELANPKRPRVEIRRGTELFDEAE